MLTFSVTMRRARQWGAILVLTSMLAACGFHLRGAGGQYNVPFNKVYVDLDDTAPFAINLKRYIRSYGATQIALSEKDADGIIDVLNDPDKTRGKSILALNSNGQVSEYLLSYSVRFKVRDNQGHELLAPTTIAATRPMTFDQTQVSAKEKEGELLYHDMQTDLVQQMMRRLVVLKPVVTASPVPAIPAVPAASAVPAVAPAPTARQQEDSTHAIAP